MSRNRVGRATKYGVKTGLGLASVLSARIIDTDAARTAGGARRMAYRRLACGRASDPRFAMRLEVVERHDNPKWM